MRRSDRSVPALMEQHTPDAGEDELLPALQSRNGSTQCLGDLDGYAADFQQLIERNGRGAVMSDSVDEGSDAYLLSLILAPEPPLLQTRPTETDEIPIVVHLQNSSTRENLEALLWKGLVTVCEIMNDSQ